MTSNNRNNVSKKRKVDDPPPYEHLVAAAAASSSVPIQAAASSSSSASKSVKFETANLFSTGRSKIREVGSNWMGMAPTAVLKKAGVPERKQGDADVPITPQERQLCIELFVAAHGDDVHLPHRFRLNRVNGIAVVTEYVDSIGQKYVLIPFAEKFCNEYVKVPNIILPGAIIEESDETDSDVETIMDEDVTPITLTGNIEKRDTTSLEETTNIVTLRAAHRWRRYCESHSVSQILRTSRVLCGMPLAKTSKSLLVKNGLQIIKLGKMAFLVKLCDVMSMLNTVEATSTGGYYGPNKLEEDFFLKIGRMFASPQIYENSAQFEARAHTMGSVFVATFSVALMLLLAFLSIYLILWLLKGCREMIFKTKKNVKVWNANTFGVKIQVPSELEPTTHNPKYRHVKSVHHLVDVTTGKEFSFETDKTDLVWGINKAEKAEGEVEQAVSGSAQVALRRTPRYLVRIYVDGVFVGCGFRMRDYIVTATHVMSTAVVGTILTYKSHKSEVSFSKDVSNEFPACGDFVQTPFPDVCIIKLKSQDWNKLDVTTVKPKLLEFGVKCSVWTVGTTSLESELRMFVSTGLVLRTDGLRLTYSSSTWKGYSGSPIIVQGTHESDHPLVIGIHQNAGNRKDENEGFTLQPLESWLCYKEEASDEFFLKHMKQNFRALRDDDQTWTKHADSEGDVYYYNTRTGKSFALAADEEKLLRDSNVHSGEDFARIYANHHKYELENWANPNSSRKDKLDDLYDFYVNTYKERDSEIDDEMDPVDRFEGKDAFFTSYKTKMMDKLSGEDEDENDAFREYESANCASIEKLRKQLLNLTTQEENNQLKIKKENEIIEKCKKQIQEKEKEITLTEIEKAKVMEKELQKKQKAQQNIEIELKRQIEDKERKLASQVANTKCLEDQKKALQAKIDHAEKEALAVKSKLELLLAGKDGTLDKLEAEKPPVVNSTSSQESAVILSKRAKKKLKAQQNNPELSKLESELRALNLKKEQLLKQSKVESAQNFHKAHEKAGVCPNPVSGSLQQNKTTLNQEKANQQ